MGLIKTIFYLVIFYFVVKFLGRVLMPLMRRGSVNGSQGNRGGGQTDGRDEGEVRIEFTKSEEAKRKGNSSEGEYVDFEELD